MAIERPRPHVPGSPNAAVDPDGVPSKIDDAAQVGVPKSLRTKKSLAEAREKAALMLDTMAYRRTDAGGDR